LSPRRAEEELLLAAARVGDAAARRARLAAALARGADPARLARLARGHRVVPLLARAAEELGEGFPAGGELRDEARQIGYRNVFLAGELVAVLRRLAAGGVSALTFKGPALAVAAYGALALRQFADLDLLVRPADFAHAREILLAGGFVVRQDAWLAVRHLSHEVTFYGHEGRVEIDLHRRALPRELAAIAPQDLWAAPELLELVGETVPTLAPETAALVLAEHAHKHGWLRLAWVADLAHLVAARPDLDWDRLARLARETGSQRVLAVGLELAARLLAAPVPRNVARDAAAVILANEIAERLFAPRDDELAGKLEVAGWQWRGRERWRDRVRYALTPNEDDWIVLPLPAPLFAVYYLIRPLRVAASYGAARVRRRLRR